MIRRRRIQANNRRAVPERVADESPPAYRRDSRESPILRFTPTAWAKLLYLRDLGDMEVGGFGISAADDLLCVEDVQLVKQLCTGASVIFDDQAVADFFDQQVDMGRTPSQFGRLWVHTHPGDSPVPSMTDEDTFARVFGRTNWALLFILARGGQTYARLRFHVGPGGDVDLPVMVDYRRPYAASDHAAWKNEYAANVRPETPRFVERPLMPSARGHENVFIEPFGADDDGLDWWPDFFDDLTFPEEPAHGNHA
jgi:hypothetical protein